MTFYKWLSENKDQAASLCHGNYAAWFVDDLIKDERNIGALIYTKSRYRNETEFSNICRLLSAWNESEK